MLFILMKVYSFPNLSSTLKYDISSNLFLHVNFSKSMMADENGCVLCLLINLPLQITSYSNSYHHCR